MSIKFDVSYDVPDIAGLFQQKLERGLKDWEDRSARYVIENITSGIDSGVDPDGRAYPGLAASTISRKGNDIPLIDKGILRDPNTYSFADGVISIDPIREQVGKYLEESRWPWWGISQDAEDTIMGYMDELVDDAID